MTINDIDDDVESTLRLFADDSILYTEVKSSSDQKPLQDDLNTIFKWADKWQMSSNAARYQSISFTRKTKPMKHTYSVDNHCIETTTKHKYLGLNLNNKLYWKDHVQSITANARRTLGVLRRNLSSCSPTVKTRAYQSLVRPKLE